MFDWFNSIISRRGYTRYLEIGVSNGGTFYNVECEIKHGVDPHNKDMLFPVTSDKFFETCDTIYDIIFIDGDHECNQVLRDIDNSINHLSPNGIILIHDTKPHTELMQRVPQPETLCEYGLWTGDVWKAIAKFRSIRNNFTVKTLDIQLGMTILERGEGTLIKIPDELTYEWYLVNQDYILNLVSQSYITGGEM
jgi:hypothetical protein